MSVADSSVALLQETHFCNGEPYVGPSTVFLHLFVVTLYSLNLNWSLAVTRKCSLLSGGYQVMHCGTALCSILSTLVSSRLSFELFSRSYST